MDEKKVTFSQGGPGVDFENINLHPNFPRTLGESLRSALNSGELGTSPKMRERLFN